MDTEYNAIRSVEEVDNQENRPIIRGVLEADDGSPSIIGTFEAHRELHDRVACVTPLSYIREDTHQTVELSRESTDKALSKLIKHLVETDEMLFEDVPAW